MTREAQLIESECEYAVVNVATDSTTVVNAPCIFYGAIVTTALSAHALPILDGSNTIGALAASAAVGATCFPGIGIRCATSLIVDPDNSGTGTITIYYRQLPGDGL
jgi:hypothetical protein